MTVRDLPRFRCQVCGFQSLHPVRGTIIKDDRGDVVTRIDFECEGEWCKFTLVFQPHKGEVYVRVETP